MRAIRCHAYTGPKDLRLEDVPDPVPGPGQALIAVEACGLGFVDGLHVQGKYQVKIPLPFTPGSEAAGRVIALGEGAPADLMGKRVAGFVMGGGLAEKALMMAGFLRRHAGGFRSDGGGRRADQLRHGDLRV